MKIARRTLLKGGAVAAVGALPLPFVFRRRHEPSSGTLVPDPARRLDLPAGFTYRVLQQQFATMSDGYRVPAVPDGMACFAGPSGTLILMRNHEVNVPAMLGPYHRGQRPPPEAYDPEAHGGVTRLVLDAETLQVRSSNLVLTGTLRNCSGGSSPWGWLTCEEAVQAGHGYVFLCPTDAAKVQPAQRITGYGRFNHEAVSVDPTTHIAYLTEDRDDSALYRFVPHRRETPFEGKLQALRVKGRPRFATTEALPLRHPVAVEWVDIKEPNPATDSVRNEAQARGAATFSRGEGIVFDRGAVHVCATSGGPADSGQIFKLTLGQNGAADTLELVAQSTGKDHLDMPDNLSVTPWGDVVMAEDGSSSHKYIRGLRPDGHVYDLARNAGGSGELAGVCFSPDGRHMFMNMYREGLTVAVSGPFSRFAAQASS